MNTDDVYYPFMVAVLSEKILEITENKDLKNQKPNGVRNLLYYNNSAPSQENCEDQDYGVIGPNTAIELLLKEGADPFYIVDSETLLLSKVLLSSSLIAEEKETFLNYLDEEKLTNLSSEFSNAICSNLFYNGYLAKLMNKGLSIKQEEFYNQQTVEIFALRQGEIDFFKPMLNYDPFSINFDHIYTYNSNSQEIPGGYERQTTLRKEITKIINADKSIVNRNLIEAKSVETALYLSKAILFQDLHKKIPNQKDNMIKKKI